jgi:hypothetical protein
MMLRDGGSAPSVVRQIRSPLCAVQVAGAPLPGLLTSRCIVSRTMLL